MNSHLYRLFDLQLLSLEQLGELHPSTSTCHPDVTVTRAKLADHLPNAVRRTRELELSSSALLLHLRHGGRMLARNGREIIVDTPRARLDPADRAVLYGLIMRAICRQRGYLVLHAAVLEHGGSAHAFLAASGGGKSTLARSLMNAGWRLLSDDACVVRFDAKRPLALPGQPGIKLLEQDIHPETNADSLPPAPRADSQTRKRLLGADLFADRATPLGRLFQLHFGDEITISRLPGAQAAGALLEASYVRGLTTLAQKRRHLEQIHMLASKGVQSFQRPDDLNKLASINTQLENWINTSEQHAK